MPAGAGLARQQAAARFRWRRGARTPGHIQKDRRHATLKRGEKHTASIATNGHVESAHRSHGEEFHEATITSPELSEPKRHLIAKEMVHNGITPHQALSRLTLE